MSHTQKLEVFRALVKLASNDSSHQMEMLSCVTSFSALTLLVGSFDP